MQPLRPDKLAALVVAWQNRHPLARRITAAQVLGVGWVALPFFTVTGDADGGGDDSPATRAASPAELAAQVIQQAHDNAAAGTLRERAAARAQQAAGGGDTADVAVLEATAQPAVPLRAPEPAEGAMATIRRSEPKSTHKAKLRAAFDEDFIAPISRRAAARFAARCGIVLASAPGDAPLREVAALPTAAGHRVTLRYIATAVVEVGAQRVRVLIAADGSMAVLGPRLFDRQRVLGVLGVLALLAVMGVTAVGLMRPAGAPEAVVAAVVMPAASAALAAAEPDASAPTPTPTPQPQPTPEPQHPPVATPAAPPAVPVVPTVPAVRKAPVRLDLRPLIDEATRATARAEAAALRGLRAASAVAAASTLAPAPSSALADTRPLFALSTRVLRTQAESLQLSVAARALLAGGGPGALNIELKVELMAAGDDWRVVAWPFASASAAEAGRQRLASRGLRLQVVEF